jgi:hypothetical protein
MGFVVHGSGLTAVEDEMEKNGHILGLICLSGKGKFCVRLELIID